MNVSTPVRGASRTRPEPAWTAQMVRPLADTGVGTPASFLRKEVTIGEPSGDEILRISALGVYRAFINGVRVGNDLLTPGWTRLHSTEKSPAPASRMTVGFPVPARPVQFR